MTWQSSGMDQRAVVALVVVLGDHLPVGLRPRSCAGRRAPATPGAYGAMMPRARRRTSRTAAPGRCQRRRRVHEHPAVPALHRQRDQRVLVRVETLDLLVARRGPQRARRGRRSRRGRGRRSDCFVVAAVGSISSCARCRQVLAKAWMSSPSQRQQHVHVADHTARWVSGLAVRAGRAGRPRDRRRSTCRRTGGAAPRRRPRRWCTPRAGSIRDSTERLQSLVETGQVDRGGAGGRKSSSFGVSPASRR